jgi:uncharacterized protein YndB with AHSA1/START domain
MKRKVITLERTYDARIEDVWALWTTKDGIESWWGPDGFRVKVHQLDLKPGGKLLYAMVAVAPPMVDFMKKSGMPVSSDTRITYREIVPLERLVYTNHVDFVPNVTAYDVETVVELARAGPSVTLTLRLDAMHDEEWTQRAVMGWEQELEKLRKVLVPV